MRSFPCRRRRAAALLELLVAMAIFGVILVVAADLLHRSTQITNRSRAVLPEERLWSALLEVSRGLEGALEIVAPTPTGAADHLEFKRVRPDLDFPTPTRLPAVLGPHPTPVPPDPWDPYAAAYQETVTVTRTAAGKLVWTSSQGTSVELAEGVPSLQCQPSAGRQLTLTAGNVHVVHRVSPGVEW